MCGDLFIFGSTVHFTFHLYVFRSRNGVLGKGVRARKKEGIEVIDLYGFKWDIPSRDIPGCFYQRLC